MEYLTACATFAGSSYFMSFVDKDVSQLPQIA